MLTFPCIKDRITFVRRSGGMADAQASGACYGNIVWVQVPSPAFLSSWSGVCGSVGTGRRARLRILWWIHRVGSSPIFRIKRPETFVSGLFLLINCHLLSDRLFSPCSRSAWPLLYMLRPLRATSFLSGKVQEPSGEKYTGSDPSPQGLAWRRLPSESCASYPTALFQKLWWSG